MDIDTDPIYEEASRLFETEPRRPGLQYWLLMAVVSGIILLMIWMIWKIYDTAKTSETFRNQRYKNSEAARSMPQPRQHLSLQRTTEEHLATRRRQPQRFVANADHTLFVTPAARQTLLDDLANYDLFDLWETEPRRPEPQNREENVGVWVFPQYLPAVLETVPQDLRGDLQNTHDSGVNSSVRQIIERLEKKYDPNNDMLPHMFEDAQYLPPKRRKNLELVTRSSNFNQSVMAFHDMTPHQAFNLAYQYAREEKPHVIESIIEALSYEDNFYDGIPSHGVRCQHGLLTRTIGALDDGTGENTVSTEEYWREAALTFLSKIRDEAGGNKQRAIAMADEKLADNPYYQSNRETLLLGFD